MFRALGAEGEGMLKTALIHDGLARGIREAAKALDKRQAHLCVLASNCDEPMYSAPSALLVCRLGGCCVVVPTTPT